MVPKRLNHSLRYKLTLYRRVNYKVRYYSISLLPTLFGEFMLTREYGAFKNKKPTRVMREYFSSVQESKSFFEKFVNEKVKRGYVKMIRGDVSYEWNDVS